MSGYRRIVTATLSFLCILQLLLQGAVKMNLLITARNV